MDQGGLGGDCYNALGTSPSPVGDSSWYKSAANLKAFVFVATVPNTNRSDDKYEPLRVVKVFQPWSFSKIEV
jgi:hypothetical protein